MQITVRHNLQVSGPDDPDPEANALILPIREAHAVMGETVAAYLARVAWRFDLPTVCVINGEFYGRDEWEGRALGVNDNLEFVSRPMGGGSGGSSTVKTITSILALVALTAIAGPAGGAAAGALFTAGTAGYAITSALVSAAIVGAPALAIDAWSRSR